MDSLWEATKTSKTRYIIITGAGISKSAGIPTFTGDDGLFRRLEKENSFVQNGEDVFNWNTVIGRKSELHRTLLLHELAKLRLSSSQLLRKKKAPTLFHGWILQNAKKIGLHITFNIDCLEGPSTSMINTVRSHGSLETLRCSVCSACTQFTDRHARRMLRSPTGVLIHEECSIDRNSKIVRKTRLRHAKTGWMRPKVLLYGQDPFSSELTEAGVSALNKQIGHFAKSTFKPVLIIAGLSLRTSEIRDHVIETAQQIKNIGGITVYVNPSPHCCAKLKTLLTFHAQMTADAFVSLLDGGGSID